MLSQYKESYTSFSGADIICTFAPDGQSPRVIGELQAITYSVTREKAPVYTMGSPDPRSFSRGKRGIAGSLVFTVFDRDALIGAMQEQTFNSKNNTNTNVSSVDKWRDHVDVREDGTVVQRQAAIEYADQVPPFNITISFVNEYGQSAVMRIIGVEILNEGSGMSIDDITTDKACTFVARRIEHMKAIGK